MAFLNVYTLEKLTQFVLFQHLQHRLPIKDASYANNCYLKKLILITDSCYLEQVRVRI